MRGERLAGQETDFGKSEREMRRALGRKVLVSEAAQREAELREVQIADFKEIYPESKLKADKRYLMKAESYMDERNANGAAAVFEQMFLDGITAGAWLGNVGVENNEVVTSFTVDARGAARYDDVRHKVDAFATLKFKEPIVDEDYDTTTSRVVLGFDVTTNGEKQAIQEKLTKSYNDQTELPFGFSHLDYYENNQEKGQLGLLPRYVIGVSGYDVRAIQETAQVKPSGKIVNFGLHSGQNLINRFKVLSEIRAENELYQAMLPDNLDSDILQQANASLYAVDQCLHGALLKCTRAIVKAGCLPKVITQEVEAAEKSGRGTKARNIIEGYLLRRSQEIFADEANEAKLYGRQVMGGQDTFVQIMETCRELTNAAYAGELDEYRGVMAHNHGIEFEKDDETDIMEA